MSGPPSLVMFIRHGEKPPKDGSPPLGVTPEGAADTHSLLVRGWIRAGALVAFFASAHDDIRPPDVIFAASAGDEASPHGKRASQTVTPLALAHGIPLDLRFAVGEESRVGAEILRQQGTVLVSWEHHNIPLIVAALGFAGTATLEWPDDRFDLIWLLRRTEPNGYSFATMGQKLLDQDVQT